LSEWQIKHQLQQTVKLNNLIIYQDAYIMIYKLLFLFIALFSPLAHAIAEEQKIQAVKAMITPQQINQLIQKFQPTMKPEQRTQFSNIVQQQLDNLSPQEMAEFANTKMFDMPNLVKKHISQIPPAEMKQIKQTLKLQKSPQQ
jgi:hypothetical protein